MKKWQQDKMSYIFEIYMKCAFSSHFRIFKKFIPSILKKIMKYDKIDFQI